MFNISFHIVKSWFDKNQISIIVEDDKTENIYDETDNNHENILELDRMNI